MVKVNNFVNKYFKHLEESNLKIIIINFIIRTISQINISAKPYFRSRL